MRKGQGLPLKTIVVGALALLVLVLVSGFFIPSVGRMFQRMVGIGQQPGQEVSNFRSNCENWCSQLKASYDDATDSAIQYSAYCTEYRNLSSVTTNDWDTREACNSMDIKDGDWVSADNDPVSVTCKINGQKVDCDGNNQAGTQAG